MTKQRQPRPEHPKPQFVREDWINLNGTWTYEFDFGQSGTHDDRELFRSKGFKDKITVPFCPESKLSGVEHKDFIPAMWYHRKITVPSDWKGKRVILHFGGVDYESQVFIDGKSVDTHFGGTVSFSYDITRFVKPGKKHDLVVRVLDEVGKEQPRGKQSSAFRSYGCVYTRTTGIWQTVWLEAVGKLGPKDIHIVPDLDGGRLIFTPTFYEEKKNTMFCATVRAGRKVVGKAWVPAKSGVPAVADIDQVRPWSPEDPFLYDIELTVETEKGEVLDAVKSYAGMRKVHIEGNQVLLNNQPLYQRLVLDQGFYPTGLWTAPTDRALKKDIQLSMEAGFNGARLHQKVFEERFHYWADKLGYLTWGESASWGCDYNTIEGARNAISEWQEIVMRDRNHPSIITWSPWNESASYDSPRQHRRLHLDTYEICKRLDPTRPVNDSSGYLHQKTDIWTVHNYAAAPKELKKQLTPDKKKGVWRNIPGKEVDYEGQPYIVDEFGGIKWIPRGEKAYSKLSFGYGGDPKTINEFCERLEGQIKALRSLKHISGWCYTQLTDIEQEQNGIYKYSRQPKFDMKRIKKIFEG